MKSFLAPPLAGLLLMCACTRPAPTPAGAPAAHTSTPADLPGTNFRASPQLDDYVVEIYEDSKGHLWFGTISKGAARWDGLRLTYFTTADGLVDQTVTCVLEDAKGNYWFGTHGGASKWDGKTWTTYAAAEGLPGGGVKLLIDRRGQLWAGSDRGAFQFDGKRFREFRLPLPVIPQPGYKVAPNKIWCLLEDSRGNLWFARDGYGACRYDGTTFTHFTMADGLPSNNVAHVAEDAQGHIWFGTLTSDFPPMNNGGVARYDGATMTRFPDVVGLDSTDTYTIYADRAGQVWISALDHGVYRYADGRFTLFSKSDRGDLIRRFAMQAMLQDSRGQHWLGFSGGLFRLRGDLIANVTQAGPW